MKRLLAHSVVYGLAETISRGTGFILLFIYNRVLSPEEIGVRTFVYGWAAFLSLFYTLGLDNAFLRYYMDKNYEHRKSDVFSTAFAFTIVIGLAFLVAALFFKNFFAVTFFGSGKYASLVNLLFIIMVFDTVVAYPTLILRAENRMMYYSIVAFARFVLFIVMNLFYVVVLRHGLDGIFEANLVVVVVVALILLPIYRSHFRLHIAPDIFSRMLWFGVPTIFTLLFMRIVDLSDRFFIYYFFGTGGERALGFYANPHNLGMMGIMVFVNSFRLAWQPFFLSLKDNPEARGIFSRVATYYTIFISMVFLGMTLFRSEILHIYAPSCPIDLADLIPFIAAAYVLYGFYLIMIAGVFIREKTMSLPIATAAAATVNVAVNMALIPVLGILGAAVSALAAYLVMSVALYILSRRMYRVEYEFGRIGIVLLVTAAVALVPEFIAPGGIWMGWVYRSCLLFLPVMIYLFGGFLKPEEFRMIHMLTRRGRRI